MPKPGWPTTTQMSHGEHELSTRYPTDHETVLGSTRSGLSYNGGARGPLTRKTRSLEGEQSTYSDVLPG